MSLVFIYLGTHYTTYDYYVYLVILFLLVVAIGLFARTKSIEGNEKPVLSETTRPIVTPIHKVWFDSDEANIQCLSFVMEKRWENDAAVGELAKGSVSYLDNHMIEIKRTNNDGRIIVKFDRLRPYSANDKIIERDTSRAIIRKFSITFSAKNN